MTTNITAQQIQKIINGSTKRKCIVCEHEFDLTEYVLHLQEEQLKQLVSITQNLDDIRECMELTYAYMQQEEELLSKEDEAEAVVQEESVELETNVAATS